MNKISRRYAALLPSLTPLEKRVLSIMSSRRWSKGPLPTGPSQLHYLHNIPWRDAIDTINSLHEKGFIYPNKNQSTFSRQAPEVEFYVKEASAIRVANRHAFQQQGWVDARRFPLMFALTSRSKDFEVEAGSLVPETAWAKAERDLSRIPMPRYLGGLPAGDSGLPFGPSETYDIIDALEVGDDATLRKLGVPSSVSQAIDALFQ